MKKLIQISKDLIKEFFATLSVEKSYFSSKKLERFVLFAHILFIIDLWAYFHIRNATVSDLVILISVLFGYAGWNTTQIRKDKLDDKAQ